ncbi:hypothetical protein [Microbacterium terregens]|uniref:Uncharacterized protein n=1 Tax=Microbacterium terregens TaxID=69363 RepID=A0ABV5SYM8_9MICO
MKTIVTAGGSFLTGTEIADAVTGYGLALAKLRDLDVVEIPFIAANGMIHRVQFRIGWQIDLSVTFEDKVEEELVEPDTILAILGKTRAIEGRRSPQLPRRAVTIRDHIDWDEVI